MSNSHRGMVAFVIIAILAISSLSVNRAAAASPEKIEESVSSGLVWLAGVQNSDGSWGASDNEKVAATAFAVLKMEDRAFELGYSSPFDPKYIYSGNVEKGLDFLFKNVVLEGDNSLHFSISNNYPVYSTSLAMAAIADSATPDRKVGLIESPVDNWDYKTIEEHAQNYLVKAQLPSGGWTYQFSPGSPADNSNSGYAVVGLAYAQEKFGMSIPLAVKNGIGNWVGYIQCTQVGPNYGGSGYNTPCDWDNILKTGNLLSQMSLVGDTSTTPRAQNAIHFIENHWNDNSLDPGWIADFVPHYQAVFCMMKGFEAMGIDKISVSGNDVDWFDVVSTAIINNQASDGSWPSDYYAYNDPVLATEWALLALERTFVQPDGQSNPKYETMKSFEQLLRDQHKLLVSFDDLMGQTPVTRVQKIEFLYSIEDLYRRQAMGMDGFSNWIDKNWEQLNPTEKAQITASLEDLLRRQAKNLDAFNGNLLAWVKTFDPVYRQKFSDSFEDLLHRQAALLKKFETVLHHDGMQTPLFLRSFEDLLRRQAQSLEGFGDLGNFTFDPAPPTEGPGIAIYKTADNTSLSCGEEVTYNYTVYNNGDQEVKGIEVTDPNLPGGPDVGTIDLLGVYQSKLITQKVIDKCSPDVVYPTKICNSATATGTASSGETVKANSDEVCIILNGPSAEVKCEPIQGHEGQALTVQGGVVNVVGSDCIILKADDGSVYSLEKNDADAWAEVQSILATGGCAEISGCAYVGLPTTCKQGTPLYVNSCKRIDCPPGSNCPDRLNIAGVDIDLKGPITLEGGCFVLTDNAGVKYELEMDENYPNAWNKVGTIQKESECAQIDGCAYSGMPTKCSGSSMPVYVKSCQEAACALSTPASVTKESVKPIVPAKNQSNVEVKKKNASLTKNQSGLEMHSTPTSVTKESVKVKPIVPTKNQSRVDVNKIKKNATQPH